MSSQALIAPRAILFGKLPSHGDFVARGLDAGRQAAWDEWLSEAMERARRRLGDRFPDAHDAASPWRFVGGPGRLGADWRAGALAASIDAVGRRFFIVLAVDGLTPAQAAACGERIAETLEGLIYQAFECGWIADAALDATQRALTESLAAEGDDAGAAHEHWWTQPTAEGPGVALATPPFDLIGEAAASRTLA